MKKERLNKIFKKWNDFIALLSFFIFIIILILIVVLDVYLLKDATIRITVVEITLGMLGALTVSVGVAIMFFKMFGVDEN